MKNVIITGASGDIGSKIASEFLALNYNAILIYNTHKPTVSHKNAFCFKCDLTHEKEVEQLVLEIVKKFKTIDCLINCAGVSLFGQIQDLTEQQFEYVINSNLKSAVFTTKYVAKNMIQNKCGKIINISSMWGKVGASVESVYSASKGAINAFTLALSKVLAPSGITVNAVCPGLIKGKMNSHLSKDELNELILSTPLGRIGTPEDVANLVTFLSSNKADFITGQIISVDGGFANNSAF